MPRRSLGPVAMTDGGQTGGPSAVFNPPLPLDVRALRAEAVEIAAGIDWQADDCRALAWSRLGRAGLLAPTAPVALGGRALDPLSQLVVVEALARSSPGVAVSYLVHSQACADQIARAGDPDQQRHWLPRLADGSTVGGLAITEAEAGSDAFAMIATARHQGPGYRLDGEKVWITNAPAADLLVVWTQAPELDQPPSLAAFVAEAGSKGWSVSNRAAMGLDGCPVGDLHLHNYWVPAQNRLASRGQARAMLAEGLVRERFIAVGAVLGLHQACVDIAINHANNRRQFGRALLEFQLVQARLADMIGRLNAARAWAYALGSQIRQAPPTAAHTAGLLGFASEGAFSAASELVLLSGAAGYDRASKAAGLARDSHFFRIGFGATDIRRLLVGRSLLAQQSCGGE